MRDVRAVLNSRHLVRAAAFRRPAISSGDLAGPELRQCNRPLYRSQQVVDLQLKRIRNVQVQRFASGGYVDAGRLTSALGPRP